MHGSMDILRADDTRLSGFYLLGSVFLPRLSMCRKSLVTGGLEDWRKSIGPDRIEN